MDLCITVSTACGMYVEKRRYELTVSFTDLFNIASVAVIIYAEKNLKLMFQKLFSAILQTYQESVRLLICGKEVNMRKIDSFPAADGHIESILMGAWQMKISFQTWDNRKLILIYNDVKSVTSLNSVYYDIGEFCIKEIENKQFEYKFYNSPDKNIVLQIQAGSMEIYDTEEFASDINAALFKVGYSYIGNQIYDFK